MSIPPPDEILGEILTHFSNQNDFFSFYVIRKSFRDYIHFENPECAKNIVFRMFRDVYTPKTLFFFKKEKKLAKGEKNYERNFVYRIKINNIKKPSFNFSKFPNLFELMIINRSRTKEFSYSDLVLRSDYFKNLCGIEKLLIYCENIKVEKVNLPMSAFPFKRLSKLKKLTLQGCEGLNPVLLSSVKTLENLCLNTTLEIDFLDFSYFPNLKKLYCMYLSMEFRYKNLSSLKNLEKLVIKESYNSHIEKDAFKSFGKLKKLRIQSVFEKNNFFKDECLKNLTNLEELCLEYCTNFVGTELKNLKKLKKLKIWRNKSLVQESFKELSHVENLNISKCENLKGKFITYFQNLKELTIFYNKVSSDDVKSLLKLEKLYVNHDAIDGKGLEELKVLKELRLWRCDKFHFEVLQKLNQLQKILFLETKLTGENLKKMNNVVVASFHHCDILLDNAIRGFSKLIKLKIVGCKTFCGKDIHFLKDHLKILVLEMNKNVVDKYLTKLHKLESIQMMSCPNIKGDFLLKLPNLITLEIEKNQNVSHTHMKNLINLRSLYLHVCPKLKKKKIKKLKLKNLKTIYIKETKVFDIENYVKKKKKK